MKILVVGTTDNLKECSDKLAGHDLLHAATHALVDERISDVEVVFDFLTSDFPESAKTYLDRATPAFLNTWKVSLSQLFHRAMPPDPIFGFNGFPTMFGRDSLEVSLISDAGRPALNELCERLNTPYHVVDDRVGLVTPRVLCMIINEAYFTVQEGTASRADIDLAMKLGTNYPYGPFEWCERIGLKYVYELLDALYHDTHDDRYKISSLMKREYLTRA